jgi:hypothetical protein
MKVELINIKADLDDFYNQVYNQITTDKSLIKKNYEVALNQLDVELENFKNKKGKYDTSIYIDKEILSRKLTNELKKVSDLFKFNILKYIKNANAELLENENIYQNELEATNMLEELSLFFTGGTYARTSGGKIISF